jgi:hypothetical protein
MTRDTGQKVDARRGRDPGKVEIPRIERDTVGGGERERRLAQFNRVDAKKKVVHHRVADDDQLEHEVGVDPGLLRQSLGEIADGRAHGRVISASPPGFIMA